jgi:hypothetical protein
VADVGALDLPPSQKLVLKLLSPESRESQGRFHLTTWINPRPEGGDPGNGFISSTTSAAAGEGAKMAVWVNLFFPGQLFRNPGCGASANG